MEIAVVCVALGAPYIRLWHNLHTRFGSITGLDANIRMHLITDNRDMVNALLSATRTPASAAIDLHMHDAPALRWPKATLLRYELMHRIWTELESDVVMYVDADTIAQGDWSECIRPDAWIGGIALVRHPGYPSRARALSALVRGAKARHLIRPLADSFMKVESGLGAWERRPISTAFVPRRDRRVYVHGAVWMGTPARLGDLVGELSDRTAFDLQAGIIARFHDESHLNWWASRNAFTLLSSRFSAVERWGYTRPDKAFLLSAEKDPTLHCETRTTS